jgi:MarR family 2-MHQ and catechol resistance regulon transcriptional repressor
MAQELKSDIDFVLWMLIMQVRNVVYKAREKELNQFEITPEQSGALFAIHTMGKEATISALGTWLVREPHSVASLLNRMERHGLIVKKKSQGMRKSATYALTPKGEKVYSNSIKRESIHKAMATLSKQERYYLESYLRKILYSSLSDMANEMKPPWP